MKRNHIVFSLLLTFALTPLNVSHSIIATQVPPTVRTSTETVTTQELTPTLMPEPILVSEAGIVMDGSTGQVLFAKNADKQLYPASITKLMTALLAIESLNPDETITFSETALSSISASSSRIGMRENEEITVNDALHGLLLMSANEVANGLAEAVANNIDSFAYQMNQRAKDLGAKNTHFTNSHGLFDPNHVTTVYDIALITQEIIQYDYFLEIMKNSMYQIPATNKVNEVRHLSQQHKMLNTKKDLKIYRPDVIAGKVGFTTESSHTLVTVARQEDRTLIAVTMKTDANNLYSDTNQLLDYGFGQFQPVTILPSDFTQLVSIKDTTGSVGTATVSLASSISFLLPHGATKESIVFTPNLPDFFTTDIAKEQVKGSVSLTYNGLPMGEHDLVITVINGTIMTNMQTEASSKEDASVSADSKFPLIKFIIGLLVILLIGVFITYKYLELKVKRARLARKKEAYLKIKQNQR